MPRKAKTPRTIKPPSKLYMIEEEREGRFYVYYISLAPTKTLFDIAPTKAQAEKAIKDHKSGQHPTQKT